MTRKIFRDRKYVREQDSIKKKLRGNEMTTMRSLVRPAKCWPAQISCFVAFHLNSRNLSCYSCNVVHFREFRVIFNFFICSIYASEQSSHFDSVLFISTSTHLAAIWYSIAFYLWPIVDCLNLLDNAWFDATFLATFALSSAIWVQLRGLAVQRSESEPWLSDWMKAERERGCRSFQIANLPFSFCLSWQSRFFTTKPLDVSRVSRWSSEEWGDFWLATAPFSLCFCPA